MWLKVIAVIRLQLTMYFWLQRVLDSSSHKNLFTHLPTPAKKWFILKNEMLGMLQSIVFPIQNAHNPYIQISHF